MLTLTCDKVVGMERYDVETIILQEVDQKAALVRSKLHNRQLLTLTYEERCAWVCFIMSLRLRAPDTVSQLITESKVELRRSLAENPVEYEDLAGLSDPPSLEAWTESNFPGLIENFGLSFFHALLGDESVGTQLLRLQWWLFDTASAGKDLFLGDRPCLFMGGIENPNLAVALPIAPDRLFLATRGQVLAQSLPQVPIKSLVARVNEATVRQASKYVYARNAASRRYVENRRSRCGD